MKQMERFKEYKDLIFSTLDSHLHSMETLMKSMKGEMEIVFDTKTNHYVTVEVHKTWASAPLRDVHVTELGREEALMICKRALHKWAVSNRRDPNLIRVETDKLTLQWGTTYEIERLMEELQHDISLCREHLASLEGMIKQAEDRAVSLKQQIAKLDS